MPAAPLTPLLLSLDPATAPVDGESARDRLAFVARFARLVTFYTIDNRVEGTWQPFMLKDAAILLATIAATDYHGLDAQLQALTAPPHPPSFMHQARIPALLRLLRHMVSSLAHWLRWLELQPEDFPLRGFLAREVGLTLAPGLARAHALHQAMALRRWVDPPDAAWHKSLGPAWRVTSETDPSTHLAAETPEQDLAQALAELRHICLKMLNAIVQTVDAAAQHYDAVAVQSTPHPDTALLRVFVDLMGHQQKVVNGIGHRHLDFYYRDILQIAPRSARPDQVVVLLSPQRGQQIAAIPAGTRFAAGKTADGTPLFFANTETAVINTASIAGAFTLKSDPGDQPFQPGIHPAALSGLEDIQRDAAGHPVDQAAFGAPCATPQGLGFAMASPMLLMEGGTRSVVLTVDMSGAAPDLTPELPREWSAGWRSWMTTAAGWFDAGAYSPPPHYSPPADGKPGRLVLEWIVPPDAPPIQPAAKPQDGRDCVWPQIKITLPPAAGAFPWPTIAAIGLEVKVRNFTNLTLWSTQAILSTAAPYPLTPVPQPGSRFLLGSREIFAKPVTRITLTLEWAAMPASLGAWYQEYNAWQAAQRPDLPAMEDEIPSGSWHWREPDGWKAATVIPPAGSTPGALFQGGGKSQFTFQLPGQRPLPSLARKSVLPDPPQALGGYLAFTLEQPPQAFGHHIYPQVLIWACQQQAQHLMQGVQAQAGGQAPPGIPNPPFTPALKSVSAEYSAHCRLVPGDDNGATDPPCPLEWHHYGPWHNWPAWRSGGALPRHAPLAPGMRETGLSLVPRIAREGCLLLAVKSLPAPCTLRLFAAVTHDGDGSGFDAWRYDTSGWKAVEVLHDDTAGLSASGIMELSLPDPPASLGPLPGLADCAWLAFTPKDEWRPLSVALLASQAVRLARQDLPADAPPLAPIPPAAITKAPLPTLAGVRQPLGSDGGRGAETSRGYSGAGNYYRRVAEHLSHKGRAVTARDFVLLAHDLMPDLFHAEILPGAGRAPGEVRLGVVPRMGSASAIGAFRPRVGASDRVALAAQLQERGHGAVTVSVHNMADCEVTLSASLFLSREALAAWPSLRQSWNLALRVYLSPWIDSDLPRYDLTLGLARSGLLRRIAAFPGVCGIEELGVTLTLGDGTRTECRDERMVAPPGRLWVSARNHRLIVAG